MIKKIKLIQNHGSLEDREPFLCDASDALVLEFESAWRLDRSTITLKNNGFENTFRLDGYRFEVPKDFLKAGSLGMEVGIVSQGVATKTFQIEPILIREMDGRVEGFPEMEQCRKETQEMKEENEKLREEFTKFKLAVFGQIKTIIDNHNKLIEEVQFLQAEQSL